MPRRLLPLLALVLLLAACSSSSPKVASPTSTMAGPAGTSNAAPPTTVAAAPLYTVATARVPSVEVFDEPGASEAARAVENPHPRYLTPRVFLVREDRGDWLNVLLPMRPNGTTGWIRKADVTLEQHDYRIEIELAGHRLTVHRGHELLFDEPVGVGTGNTPTPGGLFYTTELLIPDGQPEYGAYAYGLSGFSEVWFSFGNGGDGQFGIHGTNQPEWVGSDVSNGCIRMTNEAITKLAETLPIGVPVEIKA
ncbi:MAG: L,D-transpeptidase [Actinobacteria bacterium]|nr:L,D-transpeptidase [Actinomycetota bacterium]